MLLQGLAVEMLGPEATFTFAEKAMIEPALARLLSRLPLRQAAVVQQWLDPLMLGAGLLMWGSRMYRTKTAANAAAQAQADAETQPTQADPLPFRPTQSTTLTQAIPVRGNVVAPAPEEIRRIVENGD